MVDSTTVLDPSRRGRSTSLGLPPDLLKRSRERVRLMALLVLTGFGLDVVMFLVGAVVVLVARTPIENLGRELWPLAGDLVAVAASIGLIVATYRPGWSHEAVLKLGLGFEILVCLVISFVNPWSRYTESGVLPSLTWVTPLIILFPLIIPVRPRTTAIVAVAAASTRVLALIVLDRTGQVVAKPDDLVTAVFSPAVAVFFAVTASRVVYGLGVDLSQARRVGSYELVERLGAGGMGEVWRAKHRLLVRPAAVKLIRPDLAGLGGDRAAEALARFEREAQATALLRSSHTVALYDYGISDEGVFYYVMELLDGLDAEQWVRRFGPLPPERVVDWMRQVCDSLVEAHGQGLIHRDIKPANLYACRYGRHFDFIKVLDFGLVKSVTTADADPDLTAANLVAGTPTYLSPEQAAGREVDARSDLYSLGCVAFWLLTGHQVFEGSTAMEVIVQHMRTAPPPPSSRSEAAIPRALDELVLKCLSKDPADRPPSAEALDDALASLSFESPWTADRARKWWELHGMAATPASASAAAGGESPRRGE